MMVFWAQAVFIIATIISFPLYLLIIIVCMKEWKQNTFYLLLISQGAIDIFVVINYLVFVTLRLSGLADELFWTYQKPFVAAWCFNQTHTSIIIRCFGILVISVQRYISLCKKGTRVEQLMNTSHRCILLMIQWIFPIICSIPILTIEDVTFLSKERLEVLVNKEDITLATSLTLCFVSISFLICCFCYGAVMKFLVENRYNKKLSIKRETRLYAQMLGLFLAFMMCVIYNTMQFFYSFQSNDGPVFTLRVVFPVVSGFLSYINIYMIIILNKDMRKKLLRLFSRNADSNHLQTAIVSVGRDTSFLKGSVRI